MRAAAVGTSIGTSVGAGLWLVLRPPGYFCTGLLSVIGPQIASKIASMSNPIVQKAKEAVNKCKSLLISSSLGVPSMSSRVARCWVLFSTAEELSLAEGLDFERRLFHASFATVCIRFWGC